ncbi:hypothetical protein QBC47DRAFT_415092 [Echria macrotheca]|uniref:Uncharacterized protein n=1 Tax=Echria macrotheca TaxID=438768 RepID=A0AAJ0BBH1_9PEZI|nr:hypothetical protein QBC47DRAFT_415092 [Echria macrotheca]
MSSAATRIPTTFPTPGRPSPRVVDSLPPGGATSAGSRINIPVRHQTPGTAISSPIERNRWFCCRCARDGYRDPVGMRILACQWDNAGDDEYDDESEAEEDYEDDDLSFYDYSSCQSGSTTVNGTPGCGRTRGGGGGRVVGGGARLARCWRQNCGHHVRCQNCVVGPSHDIRRVSRTAGGLHASPVFIDPTNWECECGEWVRNTLVFPTLSPPPSSSSSSGGMSVGAGMLCANPGGCPMRWRAGEGRGILHGGSTVVNRFGQRLGTADQSVVVRGGPWWWQRRALARVDCVFLNEFRRPEHRRLDGGRGFVWREGEPVPGYRPRRAPAGSLFRCLDEYDAEYEHEYWMEIPGGLTSTYYSPRP